MKYIFAALIISMSFNSVAYAAKGIGNDVNDRAITPSGKVDSRAIKMKGDAKLLGLNSNAKKFLQTRTSKPPSHIKGLNTDFAERLAKFFKAAESAGHKLTIYSGFRDPKRQGQLKAANIAKANRAPASKRAGILKMVGSKNGSNHTKGIAADLRFDGRGVGTTQAGCQKNKACKWAHQNAAQYGLYFRMSWEPWHIEPKGGVKKGGEGSGNASGSGGQGGGGAPPMDGGGGGGDGGGAKKGGEGGGGDSGGLGGILKSLAGLIKPKPKDPNQQNQDKAKKPICTTLTTGTQKPLIPGESTTLSWVLDGGRADATIVSPGVGAVRGFSVRVAPRVSTTYTVTAVNREGRSTCPKVRVYVGARDDIDTNNDVFSDTNGSQGSDSIETQSIWGDNLFTKESGVQQQKGGQSAYDDIHRSGNKNPSIPQQSQEELDYYALKNESGGELSEEQEPLSYADYYSPTEEGASNSLLEELIPSWYEGEAQGEVIDTDIFDDSENPIQGLEGFDDIDNYDYGTEDDLTYDYGSVEGDWIDNDGIENANNLTDEEIYGSWQAPRTGNFGYAGGRSAGGGASVDVFEGKQEESVGIITRFGRWIKSIFCFWCTT